MNAPSIACVGEDLEVCNTMQHTPGPVFSMWTQARTPGRSLIPETMDARRSGVLRSTRNATCAWRMYEKLVYMLLAASLCRSSDCSTFLPSTR